MASQMGLEMYAPSVSRPSKHWRREPGARGLTRASSAAVAANLVREGLAWRAANKKVPVPAARSSTTTVLAPTTTQHGDNAGGAMTAWYSLVR